jgi:hypothetical protein
MYKHVKGVAPSFFWTLLVVASFYVWMMPALNAPAPITGGKHDPDSYYHLYSRDMVQQFDEYGYALWWGHPGLPLQIADCAVHWAKYIYSAESISSAGYTQYWHDRLEESWQLARVLMYLVSLLVLYLVYRLFRLIDPSLFTALSAMLLTLGYLTRIGYLPQIHPKLYFWTSVSPDSFAMLFLVSSFITLYYAVDRLLLTGRKARILLILSSFLVVSAVFTKMHTMGILLPIALVHIFSGKIGRKIRLEAGIIFCLASLLFSIPYISIMNRETFVSGWGIYAKQAVTLFELPVGFWGGFATVWGTFLLLCLGGMVVLFLQKRYREPVIGSILFYTFFILALNLAFFIMGFPRLHYILPAIPFMGYMAGYFIAFVLEKAVGELPHILRVAKFTIFVAILFLFTVPAFAKEAWYEHNLVTKYRELKIDEIFDKASALGDQEFMLFPEDYGYSAYFFAVRLSPVMDKRIAPGLDKKEPFSLAEIEGILAEKRIKYIVAPSLGEQVIYAPDEWLEIMRKNRISLSLKTEPLPS